MAFSQSNNIKKKEPDSNDDNLAILPTKSNSIEHAILEQDPTIE